MFFAQSNNYYNMYRLVTTYLNVNRWIYDPVRGLPRDCKNPQQADSHLKKFLKRSNDGGADTDNFAPPKPEKPAETSKPITKKIKEKLAPKRASKFSKGKLPRKKAKTVAVEDSDTMSVVSTETDTSMVLAVPAPRALRGKRIAAVVAPIDHTKPKNDEIDERCDSISLSVAHTSGVMQATRGEPTCQCAPTYIYIYL